MGNGSQSKRRKTRLDPALSSDVARKKFHTECIIIPAPEGTAKSIDAVKGKLSRSEFIRRAILHEIERVLTAKLKRTRR